MLKYPIIIFVFLLSFVMNAQTFKASQQKNTRVKAAYTEKWDELKSEITAKDIDAANFEMFVRVFKMEKILEVWLKSKSAQEFKLFKTYKICASSGGVGPKSKEGDGQVPEGFYNIRVFNPFSNYFLSLGVSYPNSSDKIRSKGDLGGDIMIHGNCVTIGCIPLTDNYIKEVYLLAVEAKNKDQKIIPVHIFPAKLSKINLNYLRKENRQWIGFWENLKVGFDYFEQYHQVPKIEVDKKGNYLVIK